MKEKNFINRVLNKLKSFKKEQKLILGSAIFALVSLIFFFAILKMIVFGIFFLILAAAVSFVLYLKHRYETFCSKCKTPYNFDTGVSYRELKRWTQGPSNANATLGQIFYQIEFDCTCANCGEKKRYNKKIGGPKITDKGDYVDVDVEALIEGNFRQNEDAPKSVYILSTVFLIGVGVVLLVGGIFLRFFIFG